MIFKRRSAGRLAVERFAGFVMGLVVMVLGVYYLWFGVASTRWPSTDGALAVQGLTQSRGPRGVVYRYSVDGTTYRATRVRFGFSYRTPPEFWDAPDEYDCDFSRWIGGLPGRLPPKAVTVYYKPDDPAISVLQPGVYSSVYGPLVIGGALVLLSWSPKPRRRTGHWE